MDTNKVLEINAALWELIAGENIEEAARVVIDYGHALPMTRKWLRGELNIDVAVPPEQMTGSTEFGDVTIQQEDEGKKSIHKTFGVVKERMGHFRLWREAENCICFHKFWKSDISTSGSEEVEVDQYRIIYKLKDLNLIHFGIEEKIVLFSFGFSIFQTRLNLMYTKEAINFLHVGYGLKM